MSSNSFINPETCLYDISEDQTKALEDYIRNIDGINTVEYKSKEDALNQLKSQFKEREDLLSGYDENNIFPASYVVTLTDLTKNQEVKQKIEEYDKDKSDTEKVIKKITSSDETITTLINLANGIRIITGVILVILIIISIFIISNTIKLTVHARRKEISIMKYVGATNSFIRWPFIVEGIVIGIISGAISVIVLGINYNLIANKILESQVVSAMSIKLLTFADMFGLIVLVYTILGVGIGVLGSCISMRRYLKV